MILNLPWFGVRGNDGGIGQAEVDDLDSASAARLGNFSTYRHVGTTDNVMIGGFIVGGANPANCLSKLQDLHLASRACTNTVSDPVFELHDANGSLLSTNDNWRGDQESGGGSYTAILHGKGTSAGNALFQVHQLLKGKPATGRYTRRRLCDGLGLMTSAIAFGSLPFTLWDDALARGSYHILHPFRSRGCRRP
jgi:hypothetical protein